MTDGASRRRREATPGQSPFAASYDVPVSGGRLHVARAGPPPADADAVVALAHGITASHVSWRAVVRELRRRAPRVCVLAPDLRGRGHSAAIGAPFGIAAHVADLLSVLDDAGARRAVLVGHSMGAYVVARVAAEQPGRAAAVVLVDGGLPLPVPAELDLDAALGPAIERLRRTFETPEEYVCFWRAHPAFAGRWNEDLEAYVLADLHGEPGALRSRVSEEAAKADFADLLGDEATRSAAEHVRAPLRLLRAPRGLLDDDNPLIPVPFRDAFAASRPDVVIEDIPDVNHYTIAMSSAGAGRVVAAIEAEMSARPRSRG